MLRYVAGGLGAVVHLARPVASLYIPEAVLRDNVAYTLVENIRVVGNVVGTVSAFIGVRI